jgi:hypothetical protein
MLSMSAALDLTIPRLILAQQASLRRTDRGPAV